MDLSADFLPVRVGPDRIATVGPVRLGNIAAEATSDLLLENGGVQALKVNATFAGTIADAASLLGPIPDYIKGAATGELTYTQTRTGQRVLEVSSTLNRADINLAPLPYFKPAGQPATAEAVVLLNERGWRVSNASVSTARRSVSPARSPWTAGRVASASCRT